MGEEWTYNDEITDERIDCANGSSRDIRPRGDVEEEGGGSTGGVAVVDKAPYKASETERDMRGGEEEHDGGCGEYDGGQSADAAEAVDVDVCPEYAGVHTCRRDEVGARGG